MKHLYIFENYQLSQKSGVGTYIKQLLSMVSTWDSIQVCMIMQQSNAKETCIGHYKGIDYLFLPKMDYHYSQNKIKSIIHSLVLYIENNKDTSFLINYIPCEYFLKELKRFFPKSHCIYVVHNMRWVGFLMGNVNILKYMILHSEIMQDQKMLHHVILKEKEQFALADHVICLCEDTQKLLIELFDVSKDKLSLISHGMHVKKNLSEVAKQKFRKRENIKDEKILISVGRISRNKGIFDFLEAFKQIIDEYHNCRWIIVGDLRCKEEFKKRAGLKILSHITFTGYLEEKELYKWYQIADIGIFPSYFEQCSYVGLEMMSNGLPVISSDGYGVRCMFQHNNNALVAHIEDLNSVTEFQKNLVSNTIRLLYDESLQKQLKNNAIMTLNNHYSLEVMESRYKEILLE